ncbi:hypothetical protein B0H63DRAFT_441713 [Podospora didyma]|uniref:Rhodopsin domain-containing protein n=1 Tax=Podospora didyma TaxID=330526 RepID=A0AAE0K2I9_9PEZI|nr:hypothetical protein B0H63DRAFT_441713 [Podospora didyma]
MSDLDALMNGPALPPPPGVVPNLVHPGNKNGLALFVLIFCSVISTICVLVRAYGRFVLLKRFQLEDALIISAFGVFCGAAWSAFSIIDTPGYYVHMWEVRLKTLIPMTYLIFVMGNTYVVVLMLLKVAMLAEWARILVARASRTSSVFWWSCMVMISLQVLGCIGIVIALNLQCIPHAASWDFTITDAKCFPLYNLQLGSGIIYLATDVIMFFMPHHLIWSLRMSWQKKAGVSVVFGLGLLACVAAAFRLHVTINYGHASDATYNIGDLIFWVMAEMACGFIITCAPTIPKILQETGVVRKIKKSLGITKTGRTDQSSGGYGRDTTKKGGSSSMLSSVNRGPLPATTISNAYYKLDEDGVALGDLNGSGSESTEYLRHEESKTAAPVAGSGPRGQIIRTTRIAIDEEVAEVEYARSREAGGNRTQWPM